MSKDVAQAPLYRHTMQRLEDVKRVNSQGDDFWIAREIHSVLGYQTWDKFIPVIEKAEASITAHGGDPSQHIAHTSKLVGLGEGAKRRVKEYFLSRGACYLIAMNGDATKPEIAGAQAYFATQTRRAELAEMEPVDRKRLDLRAKVTDAHKRVSNVAQDAGVERFGIFHNARYQGLYGASKKAVDRLKGLEQGENLFDKAGSLELSAHEFQMQLAATKIVNEGINGEAPCVNANLAVAQEVRRTMIEQSGVKPEDLPLEPEHIASVRKRLSPPKNALKPKKG
jgi:DNA-damage-inducible protein D